MIVTTVHGRYRVQEEGPGAFRITMLAGHENLPPNLVGSTEPGAFFRVTYGSIRLGVGLGFCYDRHNVQQVDCDCNRITAIEP